MKEVGRAALPSIEGEFAGAWLADPRRGRRLGQIARRLAASPGDSIPRAMGTDAATEATYRFFSNPNVEPEAILAPHVRMAVERGAVRGRLLVVHDTTSFEFEDEPWRQGLGPIRHKGGVRGFFAHVALGLSDESIHRPLGVLGLKTYVRAEERKKRSHPRVRRSDPTRESRRWAELVQEVEERLAGRARAIHVMDREADDYALLAQMVQGEHQFVVRLAHDRRIATQGDGRTVSDSVARALPLVERKATLSRRRTAAGPKKRQIHPPRERRETALHVRAAAVSVVRPDALEASLPQTLPLCVVDVVEADPPHGQPPVHWVLLTNLPIGNADDAENVVDIYRARWTIEEYFKALKTGCQFESRQFESFDALAKLLAVFAPIAWRLLLVRSLGRLDPATAGSSMLSPTQFAVLRAMGPNPLSEAPSATEVMYAVAKLGGHLKRNGPPGWQTLGLGMERLLTYELGWTAALEQHALRV